MPAFVPGRADSADARPATGGVLHHATEGILDAAAEFLWSEAMATSLDSFSDNHKDMFTGATADGEQRLEWTQAHLDFQELFDFQLEQFVGTQDFSQEEFLFACQVRRHPTPRPTQDPARSLKRPGGACGRTRWTTGRPGRPSRHRSSRWCWPLAPTSSSCR